MKNILKLLFNFVATSFRISLQMTLYWLSMLILFISLIVVERFKVTEFSYLTSFLMLNYLIQTIDY
ncbi:hypothetical protein EZS27_023554 [termite gut metagenome]|uniref:Uncharacterized protein n=1 Tax=termite gut metagenome TaxID=433724 RepID=A0A5J4R296_9ZZZZ